MAEPNRPNMKTILVAIDESENSFHALKWALNTLIVGSELAQGKIILVHAKLPATSSVTLGSPGAYLLSAELIASADKAQEQTIAEFMNRALQMCKEKQMTTKAIVEQGDPREVICDTVEKLKADFLVIGSHSYGKIKRVLLGSVSDYCAHHAKCPVLIVKKPHTKTEGTDDDHQQTP